MDWNEAMPLISHLYEDGRYRDCLLIASSCYLGLRRFLFRGVLESAVPHF